MQRECLHRMLHRHCVASQARPQSLCNAQSATDITHMLQLHRPDGADAKAPGIMPAVLSKIALSQLCAQVPVLPMLGAFQHERSRCGSSASMAHRLARNCMFIIIIIILTIAYHVHPEGMSMATYAANVRRTRSLWHWRTGPICRTYACPLAIKMYSMLSVELAQIMIMCTASAAVACSVRLLSYYVIALDETSNSTLITPSLMFRWQTACTHLTGALMPWSGSRIAPRR